MTWESLAFQPYFTSTASNIGYTWWSHDIGGHMRGYYDEDLALRWLQFGVLARLIVFIVLVMPSTARNLGFTRLRPVAG